MMPRPNVLGAAAVTGNPTGYLRLPFEWTATKRFGHGQASEYQLALPAGKTAILRLVADKGWDLSIADGLKQEVARGLFATPYDALMVLVAESAK